MSTVGVFSVMGYSNNNIFPPPPHGTEMISLTVLNTPTVLKISSTVLMISPTALNTPTVLSTPQGTTHTYRVITSRSAVFDGFYKQMRLLLFVLVGNVYEPIRLCTRVNRTKTGTKTD